VHGFQSTIPGVPLLTVLQGGIEAQVREEPFALPSVNVVDLNVTEDLVGELSI